MNIMLANLSSTVNQTGFQYFYNQTTNADRNETDWCSAAYFFQNFIEILSAVIGFPSNMYVLYLLLHGGVELSTPDIFKLNLVVLDTLYCLFLPLDPISIYLISNNDIYQYLIFVFGLNEIGAPLLLICICLDHYVAVVHPIMFMKLRNGHHRLVAIILVWVATLTYCVLMVMSTIQQKDYIFIVPFVAAYLIILFCNVSVMRALRQSGPASRELHPAKKQAFRTVFMIFIIITISFFPVVATYPFGRILPSIAFECFIFPITYSFIILRAPLYGLFILGQAQKLPCMTPEDPGDAGSLCLCC